MITRVNSQIFTNSSYIWFSEFPENGHSDNGYFLEKSYSLKSQNSPYLWFYEKKIKMTVVSLKWFRIQIYVSLNRMVEFWRMYELFKYTNDPLSLKLGLFMDNWTYSEFIQRFLWHSDWTQTSCQRFLRQTSLARWNSHGRHKLIGSSICTLPLNQKFWM